MSILSPSLYNKDTEKEIFIILFINIREYFDILDKFIDK